MRGALLLPAGALAVHQLCYLLAGEASHAYLRSPWLTLLVSAAVGAYLSHAARAWSRGARPRETALLKLWLSAGAALLAVYAGQETLESGTAAVLVGEGFWAVPVALSVGGILALLLRGESAVLRRWLRRRRTPRRRPASPPRPRSIAPLLVAPLAGAAAGRAPPGTGRTPI